MLKTTSTIFFFFILISYYSQNIVLYEYNNSQEEVFFKDITNVMYVKKGIPHCLDGSLEIKPLGRKKYAIRTLNTLKDSSEVLILQEKKNPETEQTEKVVIDKKKIRLEEKELIVEICIGNKKKIIDNIINEKLKLCTNINNDLKIVSYNIVINKLLIKVIGSRFNEKVINAINKAKKGQEIQFELIYKDVLGEKETIHSIFIKE